MASLEDIIESTKLSELRELSNGTDEFVLELLGNFQTRMTELLGQIEDAHENHRNEDVRRAVHSLKGAALSIGLKEVSQALVDLDQEVKQDNLDNVTSVVERIRGFDSTLKAILG